MLKITQPPPDVVQVEKSFFVSGIAPSEDVGKNLILTIDNQLTITGPTVTSSGTWRIDLAFKQPGYHRLSIALEHYQIGLTVTFLNELINQPSGDILAFYLGQQPDSRGRMIEEIWLWDYGKLESTHDYIQWLFPLTERSNFNRNAPVLTEEVIAAFNNDKGLRLRLFKSFSVMLKFYGLQCSKWDSPSIEVSKSEEYDQRKEKWINPRNHNYLRITRILTSLRILGLSNYAIAFFNCLSQIYAQSSPKIGTETYNYWQNAVD
ncbi:opioid growth factor receptor-related protein [Floridanema aerugineum]|uniref:Opioid growth factor receptor-related protein n=1 Tax=Floridaenema aerugineum BLCC-F46 TaxID=3153654 RepID=A0ABV4X9K9_9CYAN